MKSLISFRGLAAAVLACSLVLGCATTSPGGTPASPTQQAVNSTTVSYKALDTAILQADAAVKAGILKGQDARNAVKGLTDAKAGLDVALVALRAANAAAAAAAAAASSSSPSASGAKP